MGRFFDFAKRRIAGYIVFWILVILFLGLFYRGDAPATAGVFVIIGFAFIASLLYTRRMKRRQRARRDTKAAVAAQTAFAVQATRIAPPPGAAAQAARAPQAPQSPQTPPPIH